MALVQLAFTRSNPPVGGLSILYWLALFSSMGIATYFVLVRRLWAKAAWLIIIGVLVLFLGGLALRMLEDPSAYSVLTKDLGVIEYMYAAGYTLAVVGLVYMLRRTRRRLEPLSVIDAGLVFIVAFSVGTEMILVPLYDYRGLAGGFFLQIYFLVINSALMALAVRMWLTTSQRSNTALRIVMASVVIFVANDISSTAVKMATLGGAPHSGLWDALYIAGNVLCVGLCAAAASHPTAVNAPSGTPHVGKLSPMRSIAAVFLAMAIPVWLLSEHDDLKQAFEDSFFLGVWLICFFLLNLRSVLLVEAYREAVRREKTLRLASGEVQHESTAQDPWQDLRVWIEQLLPRGHEIGISTAPELLDTAPIAPIDMEGASTYQTRAVCGPNETVVVTITAVRPLDPFEWASIESLVDTTAAAQLRRTLLEQQAAANESVRLSSLMAEASDMVVLLDEAGQITVSAGAAEALTGESAQLWQARGIDELLELDRPVQDVLASSPQRQRFEAAVRASGRTVEVTVNSIGTGEIAVALHDITERNQLSERLVHQARHDSLTALPNRVSLNESLDAASDRWERERVPYSVIFLDLDDFKVINDSLGHHFGDQLLAEMSLLLQRTVSPEALIARLGGDEFAILMHATQSDVAVQEAAKVVKALRTPLTVAGIELTVKASAGVATSSEDMNSGPDVLQAADLALFEAKSEGKGHISTYHGKLKDTAVKKLTAANSVTVAARNGDFVFEYQPICDLERGEIVAVEALMRWPSGGNLSSPEAFIPIADSIGELTSLIRALLPEALEHVKRWRRSVPDLVMTFNLHASALMDDDFERWITRVLQNAGLPPSSLAIELTEQALVPAQAVSHLSPLYDLGLGVYIDDFGTGWSNLSYLSTLPITGLKLARQTIIDEDADVKSDLVHSIVGLARANGLRHIVAEGIETQKQRVELQALGIDTGQGWLFSRSQHREAITSDFLLQRFGTPVEVSLPDL